VTTVFVTHDQREAMALADRIVILNQGKIEQAATPAEIYRYPQTRFVAEFIGNNNLLDVEISSGATWFGDVEIDIPEDLITELSGRQTLAIRPELIHLARAVNEDINHDLRGRVVLQRQVGALVEREIDVAGTIIRQTEFQNTAASLANGDEVVLSWDWSQVWMLPQ